MAGLAALVVNTAPAASRADDRTDAAAAAESVFAEARALAKEGRWSDACPKFETSYKLDPAVGTLLNLAECWARTGRTASAWLRYREAASMALRTGQKEREAIARERARALETRLCRLVVREAEASRGAVAGGSVSVRRDGEVVDAVTLGVAVPVDPGPHVVTAAAADQPSFERRVVVVEPSSSPGAGGRCEDTVVTLPAFALVEPPASPPRGITPRPADAAARADSPGAGGFRAVHALAVAAAVGGVAAIGVGVGFAASAASTKGDADAQCSAAGCTATGRSLLADAGRSADVATIALTAGAVLLVTGVVLWLASPPVSRRARSMATSVRF
jgi:hypothetical protein